MGASWLLRSARGQAAILELPSMRYLSGRASAGQGRTPTMQVRLTGSLALPGLPASRCAPHT